jgi:hypothetical protein
VESNIACRNRRGVSAVPGVRVSADDVVERVDLAALAPDGRQSLVVDRLDRRHVCPPSVGVSGCYLTPPFLGLRYMLYSVNAVRVNRRPADVLGVRARAAAQRGFHQ